MKKFTYFFIFAFFVSVGPENARADVIEPGKYVADFPGDQCGMLTINQYGNISYSAGSDCSGDVATGANLYEGRKVRMRGTVIDIDDASFAVKNATSKKIVGTWTLGDYVADITFKRQ